MSLPTFNTASSLFHLYICIHTYFQAYCSASIIVAYLMRSEQKSLESLNSFPGKRTCIFSSTLVQFYSCGLACYFLPEALEYLKEVSESACPNDGFLDQMRSVHDLLAAYELLECLLLSWTLCVAQLKLFEEMGFKVDNSSPLYKRFRLKLLG